MRQIRVLAAALILVASEGLHGQAFEDFGCWTGLEADYRLNARDEIQFSQQFRFNENASELNNIITEAGFKRTLIRKYLSVAAAYRISHKRQEDDLYSRRHRLSLELTGKYDLSKRWTSAFRSSLQGQLNDVGGSDDWRIPGLYWRNRLSVKYQPFKKWQLGASTELFTNITTRQNVNVRGVLSVQRSLSRYIDISVFGMHQREFNVAAPQYDYVLGIDLAWHINPPAKKKKNKSPELQDLSPPVGE